MKMLRLSIRLRRNIQIVIAALCAALLALVAYSYFAEGKLMWAPLLSSLIFGFFAIDNIRSLNKALRS